jgi:iron only hydrogenase large subunit-like protein
MVAALHRLGFNRVFDVNFGADLTITEESQELVNRIAKKTAPLPQITSCSPGWINYMEFFYSDLIPHVSTCKSPARNARRDHQELFREKHGLTRRTSSWSPSCPAPRRNMKLSVRRMSGGESPRRRCGPHDP